MSELSPILALPYLMPAQAQKHVTHNLALQRLDALVQAAVEAIGTTVPPGTPAEGEGHVVGPGASGSFAGHDGEIAVWTAGAWNFLAPRPGWRVWDRTAEEIRIWEGTAWILPPAARDNLAGIGIGTTSDPVNRLAVQSEAALFTHAGAGHRLTINKASGGDTASVLYQSGWTGHAEIGLTGDTDLSVKVSPDGSAWTEALRLDAATGRMTGAAVQQSTSDTTPGRAMITGAGGLMIPRTVIGDLTVALAPGKYCFVESSATGSPGTSSYYCTMDVSGNATNGSQNAVVIRNSLTVNGHRMWLGARAGASGGAWTWTEVRHLGNLLGTVAQSGGVPTGAVIERGSNSNGSYTRFADGTQICWHSVSFTHIATAAGPIYSSSSDTNWTFPAVFSAVPDVKANSKTSSVEWAGVFCGSTTVASIRGFRATSASGSRSFGVFAIGRWF